MAHEEIQAVPETVRVLCATRKHALACPAECPVSEHDPFGGQRDPIREGFSICPDEGNVGH